MDLLERYLQAVGEYLPARTKADTLAELRERLHQRKPVAAQLDTARLVREEREVR